MIRIITLVVLAALAGGCASLGQRIPPTLRQDPRTSLREAINTIFYGDDQIARAQSWTREAMGDCSDLGGILIPTRGCLQRYGSWYGFPSHDGRYFKRVLDANRRPVKLAPHEDPIIPIVGGAAAAGLIYAVTGSTRATIGAGAGWVLGWVIHRAVVEHREAKKGAALPSDPRGQESGRMAEIRNQPPPPPGPVTDVPPQPPQPPQVAVPSESQPTVGPSTAQQPSYMPQKKVGIVESYSSAGSAGSTEPSVMRAKIWNDSPVNVILYRCNPETCKGENMPSSEHSIGWLAPGTSKVVEFPGLEEWFEAWGMFHFVRANDTRAVGKFHRLLVQGMIGVGWRIYPKDPGVGGQE